LTSESLQRAAAEAMRGDGVIVLGAEDSAVFAEALLNPPEPGPVLRGMARRYGLTHGSTATTSERGTENDGEASTGARGG